MNVTRLRRLADFEPVRPAWQQLAAGRPMQGWSWQSAWWDIYGLQNNGFRRELLTLVVKDGSRVIAIAPWMIDRTSSRGRVIRFLGEDEVCSEYPTILCAAGDYRLATAALADYLVSEFSDWDLLELCGVEGDDAAINGLIANLAERGFTKFLRRNSFKCWRLSLPESWDEYLQLLSKSHRVQLRRLQRRVLDQGQIVEHRVLNASQLETAWDVLVDLHQQRRISLGEDGCFASCRFKSFHHAVCKELLAEGQLRLVWFESDGRPLSVEYNLRGASTTYAYQGGLDPDRLGMQPGRISTLRTIQWSIEEGHRIFDFLRGDEPYKAHWRAQPVDMYTVRVVAERRIAQFREATCRTLENVKDWIKAGWHRAQGTATGAHAS